jgi:hypothetical protein
MITYCEPRWIYETDEGIFRGDTFFQQIEPAETRRISPMHCSLWVMVATQDFLLLTRYSWKKQTDGFRPETSFINGYYGD